MQLEWPEESLLAIIVMTLLIVKMAVGLAKNVDMIFVVTVANRTISAARKGIQ